jgi:hypothetical protein
LSEHDRFEEFASLAALGELSAEEHEEFLRHKKTCLTCREIVAKTKSLATAAFLAGSPRAEDPTPERERHRRLRNNIARSLPTVAPAPHTRRYKRLVAAAIAAAFLVGVGVGTAGVRLRTPGRAFIPTSSPQGAGTASVVPPKGDPPAQSEVVHLQAIIADLQKRIAEDQGDGHSLQAKLAMYDQHATELQTRLDEVNKQSAQQAQELAQARNELATTRDQLTLARESAYTSEAKITSLEYKLADREARLSEATASVEREREMLSAGREVRDIMGARDLHIVDVVDRDGKGRSRKAFGRAFYTQGKSLIFYAFDLPTKSTADGRFVFAAWGSNSNNLNGKATHSLGIFYNDDQAQHRWAMKFDDPKILDEIDTVFVTLEPAGKPFSAPTGKALLEAYFGTPPNHP